MILLFAGGICALVGCITDLVSRQISNHLCVCTLLILSICMIISQAHETWFVHVLSLCLSAAIFIPLFFQNVLGGGDVKFLISLSLMVPISDWLLWITLIALSGGIQSLITLICTSSKTTTHIPYGVAIAVGTWGYIINSLLL